MKKGSDAVRAAQTLKESCVNAIYTTWKDHLEKFLDNNKKVEEDLINKGFVEIPESCKERAKETMGVIQERNDFNEETMNKLFKEAIKKIMETLNEAEWKADDEITKLFPITN